MDEVAVVQGRRDVHARPALRRVTRGVGWWEASEARRPQAGGGKGQGRGSNTPYGAGGPTCQGVLDVDVGALLQQPLHDVGLVATGGEVKEILPLSRQVELAPRQEIRAMGWKGVPLLLYGTLTGRRGVHHCLMPLSQAGGMGGGTHQLVELLDVLLLLLDDGPEHGQIACRAAPCGPSQ
jgi:hypothetical protein